MSDYDITRINTAIWNKKNSIDRNRHKISYITEDIFSAKIQMRKTNPEYMNSKLESDIKIDNTKIKKLKKEMRISIKELQIYGAEYKKKRKDPNYRIDFNLLIKKHNKNNIKI